MDECIDSLGYTTMFSTMDTNTGYWPDETVEDNREISTFTLHHCPFRFILIPLGLKNAPGTFQRAMNVMLTKVKRQFVVLYFEDIFIIFAYAGPAYRSCSAIVEFTTRRGHDIDLEERRIF